MKQKELKIWSLLLVVWSIVAYRVECYVFIKSSDEVQAIYHQDANLMCRIDSNKIIKAVIWFKEPNEIIYYYDPPSYNHPSKPYKDRASLDYDSSSLILKTVDLDDEAVYKCRVSVEANQTLVAPGNISIPEEEEVFMQLVVNVPPNDVKLTTFQSAKNLTLTCRSTRSKPPANIKWLIFKDGKSREVKPNKIISDFTGPVADTIGYLYWTIKQNENGTTFQCVVDHPETVTTLRKNVTLVAPNLRHPVAMKFDWLGDTVDYSTYATDKSSDKNVTNVAGLVSMDVIPGDVILVNTSVIVSVSANGAFPEPRFTWWGEDFPTSTGNLLRIAHVTKNQQLFCLVENPVGRVVMSVEITASATDPVVEGTPDTRTDSSDEDILTSGAVVAAIAFSSLAMLFLLGFLIYYFAFKRPSDKKNDEGGVVEGSDDFVEKQKPLYSDPSNRTKLDHPETLESPLDTDSLLKRSPDTPPVPYNRHSNGTTPEKKKFSSGSLHSSATTTSGYSDQLNGRKDAEIPRGSDSSPEGKERAITKHLQDFDENASFLGEYGSTFGLDTAGSPALVEVEARESPFDESGSRQYQPESDAGSVDSGASGHEGRYTLPHGESWEHIDPNKVVHTPV